MSNDVEDQKKCGHCDGTGRIRDDWFPGDEGTSTCPRCNGTGKETPPKK